MIKGGKIDIKAGLDGVMASQEFILEGGEGTIWSRSDVDYWGVIVNYNDTIIVSPNIEVKGWNGQAVTSDAIHDEFSYSGNRGSVDGWSFFDASSPSRTDPLRGIQWGPRGTQVTPEPGPGPDFDLDNDGDVDGNGNVLSRNGVPQTGDSTGFYIGAIVLLAAVGGSFIVGAFRRRLTSK